jgi:hypothetical protein
MRNEYDANNAMAAAANARAAGSRLTVAPDGSLARRPARIVPHEPPEFFSRAMLLLAIALQLLLPILILTL